MTFSNRNFTKMFLEKLNQDAQPKVDQLSAGDKKESDDGLDLQIDSSTSPLMKQSSSLHKKLNH